MAYVPNLQSYSKAGAPPSKGALLAATGVNSAAWLAPGPDTDTVVADTTQTDGLRWTAATPIVIDETNADYQGLVPGSVSASGASGLIADAKHTHSLPGWGGNGAANTFSRSDHIHQKAYVIPHTFSLPGLVQVQNGSAGYIPGFFVHPGTSGETIEFYGWLAKLRGGTSAQVTFSIQRIPSTSGIQGAPVTMVVAGTGAGQGNAIPGSIAGIVPVSSPVALSAADEIVPVISAVTNVPDGLSLTVFVRYTLS